MNSNHISDPPFMKFIINFMVLIVVTYTAIAQVQKKPLNTPGYEYRIRKYVDSLKIIDPHEHLFPPGLIKGSNFLDFMLLFHQNGLDDLKSAGLPDSLFYPLFNKNLPPKEKWKIIEPYWNNTFNTSFSRLILESIKNLYGINDLNASTVDLLSRKIKQAYNNNWFDRILKDSCQIAYVIEDGYNIPGKDDYFRYAKRFESWLTVRSKYRIDSLAIQQLNPIYTLEDFVNSLNSTFEKEVNKGMVAVKINTAYSRTLHFEKVETEVARKLFRSLVNGGEDHVISSNNAKPLQDYMLFRLLDLAEKYKIPVAIHTGLQAGLNNNIINSNPTLLINIFREYPDVNFVLYHGSYPFGGELSALAKNYKNVYIDMNWVYSISPSYGERYLNEWIETVPVGRLMAFGGDCMVVENVYSELRRAKQIISNILSTKVSEGYFTESEAKTIAKMILYDNAAKLYGFE